MPAASGGRATSCSPAQASCTSSCQSLQQPRQPLQPQAAVAVAAAVAMARLAAVLAAAAACVATAGSCLGEGPTAGRLRWRPSTCRAAPLSKVPVGPSPPPRLPALHHPPACLPTHTACTLPLSAATGPSLFLLPLALNLCVRLLELPVHRMPHAHPLPAISPVSLTCPPWLHPLNLCQPHLSTSLHLSLPPASPLLLSRRSPCVPHH